MRKRCPTFVPYLKKKKRFCKKLWKRAQHTLNKMVLHTIDSKTQSLAELVQGTGTCSNWSIILNIIRNYSTCKMDVICCDLKYFAEEPDFKVFSYSVEHLLYKCSKEIQFLVCLSCTSSCHPHLPDQKAQGCGLPSASSGGERMDGKGVSIKDVLFGSQRTFQCTSQTPRPLQVTLLVMWQSHGQEQVGSVCCFWICRNSKELHFLPCSDNRKKRGVHFLKLCKESLNTLFTLQLIFFFWPLHAQMELFGLCWCYPWGRHQMCSPGALRARRAGSSSPKAAARPSYHTQSRWQRVSPCCHLPYEGPLVRVHFTALGTLGCSLSLWVSQCALQEFVAQLKWCPGTCVVFLQLHDPGIPGAPGVTAPVHLCSDPPLLQEASVPKMR